MPYVNLAEATKRLRLITRNADSCIKKRNHRFVACVPNQRGGRGVILNYHVRAVAPDLGDLLAETLSVEVVMFIERHKFEVPPDEQFHKIAELYVTANTEVEAVANFLKVYKMKLTNEVEPANV